MIAGGSDSNYCADDAGTVVSGWVFDQKLTDGVGPLHFTGLDGNADKMYRIDYNIQYNGTVAAGFRMNGLATSIYETIFWGSAGGTTADIDDTGATTELDVSGAIVVASADRLFGTIALYVSSNDDNPWDSAALRPYSFKQIYDDGGSATSLEGHTGTGWIKDGTTNIINVSVLGTFNNNSVFKLYKCKYTNGSASTECNSKM